MLLTSWLRGWFGRADSQRDNGLRTRRRPKPYEPRRWAAFAVEPLEARLVLTAFNVNVFTDSVDVNPGDGLAEDASGNTSLRAAIMEANALGGTHEIQLPAGTYTLTLTGAGEDAGATGDLDIGDPSGNHFLNLQIIRAGAATAIIEAASTSGQGIDRVFDISDMASVTIAGVTIRHGKATNASGGGVRADGTLTLTDVIVTENQADQDGGGLAVTGGFFTMKGGLISSNVAGNRGGGLENLGSASLFEVKIELNSSVLGVGQGGGIYSDSGSLELSRTTLTNNQASFGGGAYLGNEMFGGSTNIDSSTIDNNSATMGGGLFNNASLSIRSSTISSNTAVESGAGIYQALGLGSLEFSTVTANTVTDLSGMGGGVFLETGTFSLRNTIVSENVAADGPDLKVPGGEPFEFQSLGRNLIGDDSASVFVEAATDLVGAAFDPLLGPLANNGGFTRTHALLAGSAAIDAGGPAIDNDFGGDTPDRDQRLAPRANGGLLDIGAFETGFVGFIVTSTEDLPDANPGDGIASAGIDPLTGNPIVTLRAAVMEANALAGHQSIALREGTFNFSQATVATDSDATGDLDITDSAGVTIFGISADETIIRPKNAQGVALGRAFQVSSGATLDLRNVKITEGNPGAGEFGGAVLVDDGTLNLFQTNLTFNTAQQGGAIAVTSGTVNLESSSISANTATTFGGAIFVDVGGSLVLQGSLLQGNSAESGSAVANSGTATIFNSDLSSNSASGSGTDGAILNSGATADLTLSSSTVRSSFGSQVGGLVNQGGTVLIQQSTFSANFSTNGAAGVLNDSGSMTIENSTFSGNSAFGMDAAGAIKNLGTLTVRNATITLNSSTQAAGGLINAGTGTTTLLNTIVAQNTGVISGRDIAGTFSSSFNNLIGDLGAVSAANFPSGDGNLVGGATIVSGTFAPEVPGSGGGVTQAIVTSTSHGLNDGDLLVLDFSNNAYDGAFTVTVLDSDTFRVNGLFINDADTGTVDWRKTIDAVLGNLKDNSSDIFTTRPFNFLVTALATHVPQVGSPAIDAGTSTNAPSVDQYGNPRPQNGGVANAFDIGAVERTFGTIRGSVFVDADGDGMRGAGEADAPFVRVTLKENPIGRQVFSFSDSEGVFEFDGVYQPSPFLLRLSPNGQFVSVPATLDIDTDHPFNAFLGGSFLTYSGGDLVDLNGDSLLDLLQTGTSTLSGTEAVVIVNRALSNGQFGSPQSLSLPGASSVRALAVADLDFDGDLDVVVTTGGSDKLFVLSNDGTGQLSIAHSVATGANPSAIAVGDFDGDGHQDVAITNQDDGRIQIALGNGNLTFDPLINVATGTATAAPLFLLPIEFDGFGGRELLVANSGDGTVSQVHFDFFGSEFVNEVLFTDADGVNAFAIADFDRDFDQDFVATGDFGVAILLNTGNSTTPVIDSVMRIEGDALGVVVGDFDGDFYPDLAVTSTASGAGKLSLLRGLGDGHFVLSATETFATPIRPVSVISLPFFSLNGEALPNFNRSDLLVTQLDGAQQKLLANITGATPVELNDAGEVVVELAVQERGTLSGRVTDEAGNGVPNAVVFDDRNHDGIFQFPEAVGFTTFDNPLTVGVDEAGFFTFDVAPGDVLLRVSVFGKVAVSPADPVWEPAKAFDAFGSLTSTPTAASVDLNSDPHKDLLLGAQDSVQVFLGTATGGFEHEDAVFLGDPIQQLVTGDYDQDGNVDFAVVTNDTDISVYFGDGSGGFTFGVGLTASNPIVSAATGDLNHDTIDDLAFVVPASGDIQIFRSNGNRTFTSQQYSLTSVGVTSPSLMTAGDFDGDGFSDLAILSKNSTTGDDQIGIHLSRLNGSNVDFVNQFEGSLGFVPGFFLQAGDVNGDDAADLLVGSDAGSGTPGPAKLFLNLDDGNGSLDPGQSFSGSRSQGFLTDVTGDGDLDVIVVADLGANSEFAYRLFENNGLGTFELALETTLKEALLPVALDVNGDARSDLVTFNSNFFSVHNTTTGSYVLDVASGQDFADLNLVIATAPVTLSGVVYNDLNNNAFRDIGEPGLPGVTVFVDENFNGQLDVGEQSQVTGPTGEYEFANLDGDAAYAVTQLAPPPGFSVTQPQFLGTDFVNTFSQFATSATASVGDTPRDVVLGDFNGDGRQDIATANEDGDSVTILFQNADGSLSLGATISVGVGPVGLAARNLNGDDDLDLVVSHFDGTIRTLINDGSGANFTANVLDLTTTNPSASLEGMASADLDNDGDNDVAVVDVNNSKIYVLSNDGTGVLSLTQTLTHTDSINGIRIAFLGGAADTGRDIIATSAGSDEVLIFTNDGNGTFGSATALAAGVGPVSLEVADFNNDGLPDIVSTVATGLTATLFTNTGSGFTSSTISLPNFAVTREPLQVRAGHLQGDIDPALDLVFVSTINGIDSEILTLAGNGDGTFQFSFAASTNIPRTSFDLGSDFSGHEVIEQDYSGDGLPDIVVSEVGTFDSVSVLHNLFGTYTYFAGSPGPFDNFNFGNHTPPAAVTVAIDGSDNLTITGSADNDQLMLATDGTNLLITSAGILNTTIAGATGDGTSFVTVPLAAFTGGLIVDTLAGDDFFTVDLSDDFDRPFQFIGGAGEDTVTATGGGSLAEVDISADIVSVTADITLTGDLTVSAEDVLVLSGAEVVATGSAEINIQASRSISVSQGTITAANGDLTLAANQGSATSGQFIGIDVAAGVVATTGTGNLTLQGRGGDSGSGNVGVKIYGTGSAVRSTNGVLVIQGTGGDGTNSNFGVELASGAVVRSLGTDANAATITIQGTGGAGANANTGVQISGAGTQVVSTFGDIQISGLGGDASGSTNFGVNLLDGAQVLSQGTDADAATITISGTGGDGLADNNGVVIAGTNTLVRSVAGAIEINGMAGGGSDQIVTGVQVIQNAHIESTGTGSLAATITINGSGGTEDTPFQTGIFVGAGNTVITSVDGAIALNGTGGPSSGEGLHGFVMNDGTISSTGTGADAATITLMGMGGPSGTGRTNDGVSIIKLATITSAKGDVQITGIGGAGGTEGDNWGLELSGTISVGSTGSLSLSGTGGAGTGTHNFGIQVFDGASLTTTDGTLSLTGSMGGSPAGTALAIETSGTNTIATNGSGELILVGDSIEIGTNSTLRAGSAGDGSASIHPSTNGTGINLGSTANSAANTLELSDAELDRVSAGTLQIGDTNSGTITVSAAITHANNLSLTAGAGITVNQSVTMASNKSFSATTTSATAGISLATTNSDIAATGTGSISLTAERNVSLLPGSSLATQNGGITVVANSDGAATGNFVGVELNEAEIFTTGAGAIQLTGQGGDDAATGLHFGIWLHDGASISSDSSATGDITLIGTGGDGTQFNYGVLLQGSSTFIESTNGDINLIGAGGAGSDIFNIGVVVQLGADILSFGTGTGAGQISIGGTGTGGTDGNMGVLIEGAGVTVTSVDGDIDIDGDGSTTATGNSNHGVEVANGAIVSSTGTTADAALITIGGTAGSGVAFNFGVHVFGSGTALTSHSGNIEINGNGSQSATGTANNAIQVDGGASITSTGTSSTAAAISLNGSADAGTSSNAGVIVIGPNTLISAVDGDIEVVGQGAVAATGDGNIGVQVVGGAVISSTGTSASAGTISITGTGGSGGTANFGIHLFQLDTEIRSVAGTISLEGHGSESATGDFNHGIQLDGAEITSTGTGTNAASISLTGTGGTGNIGNVGLQLFGSTAAITSIDGDIVLSGTGGVGSGDSQVGVNLFNGIAIRSTGTGSEAAAVSISGQGGEGAGFNLGIQIQGIGTTVASVDGDLSLFGTGGAGTGELNTGVFLDNGPVIESTGTGAGAAAISITGTGGTGSQANYGVGLSGPNAVLRSVDGAITIDGTAVDTTGDFQTGVIIEDSVLVQTTGTASLSITGSNATLAGFSFGVLLIGNGSVSATGALNTIIADSLELVTGGSINTGTNTLVIHPETNGTAINLGGADAASTLGLTDADLDQITAAMLTIGDSNSGAITISDAITRAAPTILFLTTGGNNGVTFSGSAASLDANGGDIVIVLDSSGSGGVSSGGAATDISANGLSITSGSSGIGASGNPLTLSISDLSTFSGDNSSQFFRELDSLNVSALDAGTGTVQLDGGTFQLAAANVIADDTDLSVASSAVLDLNGFDETIDGLSGDGVVDNTAAGTAKLMVGDANGDSTFSGTLQDTGGNLSLTKVGSGRLILATGNTYAGVTTVSGGVLEVQNSNSLGASSGGTVVDAGATLELKGGPVIANEPLQLSGTGISGTGALCTGSAGFSHEWDGPITLVGSAAIGVGQSNSNLLLGGNITGGGTLSKVGSGELSLSGTNTYTGDTTIDAGKLFVNGSITSDVTVTSGTTLGGSGTISSANSVTVNSGGTVAPGNSPGILNTGDVTFSSGSTFSVEVNGSTPGTQHDQLNVTGTVSLGGATLSASGTIASAGGQAIVLINNDGTDAVSGTFNGLAEGATVTINGVDFLLTYVGGTGNDVVLIQTGTLTIIGTNADDVIDISTVGSSLQTSLNGSVIDVRPLSTVTGLSVDGLNGNDLLNFNTNFNTGGNSGISLTSETINLNGNLQTDGGAIDLTGDVRLGTSVTLDSEEGDNSDAGSITLSGGSVSAISNNLDLTINTSTGGANSSGAISLPNFSNGGSQFVRHLTVDATNSGSGEAGDVTFTDSATLTAGGNFSVSGQTISMTTSGTELATAGSGTVNLTATRNISLSSGTTIRTEDGDVTLNANTAGTTSGNFVGIDIVEAVVQSTNGAVQVTGTGGDSGSNNHGVRLAFGGTVQTTGNGDVTVMGTGGTGVGTDNYGVYLDGNDGLITSGGGDVGVTGVGGGGTGTSNHGVFINSTGEITSGGTGTVTVNGTGGPSSGGSNYGVILNPGGQISSGGAGAVTVTGTAGSGGDQNGVVVNGATITSGSGNVVISGAGDVALAISGTLTTAANGGSITLIGDSMAIDEVSSIISAPASSSVTLRQRTNGLPIDLGAPLASTLVFSDAVLDVITAGTLNIGNMNSGSIRITDAITRTAATNITLTTAVNNHLAFIGSSASLDANGGDVTISLSGSGSAFVASGDATTDIIANALSITSGVDGIGADGNPLTFNASSLTTNTTGKLDGLQFLSAANSVSVLGLNAGTSTVRLVSGTFQSSASNVIADATNISLDHRATLDLNNFSDTIGALTLEIGTGNGADVTTGTGTLTLGGNVTLTTINQGAIGATISGNLSLGGATRTISVDNGNAVNDLVISANVSGTNVGLQKTGTGNLVLSGTNTYTGATTVSDGSLSLNGSITSNTTVADGATLNGAGTINSGNTLTVQSGGTVAPGTSPGILNTGNVTLQSGSTFNVELNGTTAGTGYDQLNVTGTVTINSNVTLNPSLGFTPAPGDTFVIINNDGTDDVSGPFDGLEQGKLLTIGGAKFHIHYFHDSADTVGGAVGNDVALIANRNPLINNQMFSLGEDSENGAEVGSVMASDPDAALASIIGVGGSQSGGGQSSGGFTVINIGTVFVPRTPPVTFAITAGNVGNAFAIGSDTGIITVNDASAVDFETNPTFNLTVEVTDDAGATSTATVTINLANVAPSIPVDADSAPNRVSDTDLNGATVGITASSSDVHGGAITYSLTDDANGRFTIGMTSGIVTVANASLIQPVTTYSITVQASDGTDSSSQTFAIDAFFDAPDAPQDVDRQENSVPEGAPQGSRVGVTAFALDHQDDDVFYQLIDDAGGRFDIDLVTGVVTVERSSLLVFQGNPTRHTIQVQATDERGNVTAVVPFTIDVTEVPDLSPPIASILPTRTSVVEGDFGTPFANFKVQLNKTSTDTITVDFITRRGDAPNFTLPDGIPNDPNLFASDGTGGPTDPLGPRDFFLTTGRLTFAPGVDEQPIRIPIRPDDRPEPNEFFFVQLLSPVNASLAPQQSVAIAQILDDDSVPQLLVSNAQVLEGDGVGEPNKLVFTVNLVGDFPPGETTATVDFMTGNPLIDSATADDDPAAVNDPTLADYVATSGTLTFTNSTRLQTIEVTILGDLLNTPDENALNIADETLTLRFENEMNLGLARRTVTGTIINDDDNNVVLSLTPNPSDLRAVREGNAGDLLPIEFVVTLVGKTTETVTVNFATVDISATGSATAAATPGLVADYTSTSGMLTFLPGEVTQTFTVLVRGDTDVEADEAFNVVISLPATSQPNVTIDPDRASSTIVIRNDDQAIPTEDGDELVEQLTDAFNAGGGAKNPAVVAMLREQAMQFIEANGLTDYILIIVDPVDVILTDPQNRSTGFTETPQTIRGTTVQGVVNQIPGTYYSGDGNVEVLVVPLPAAGTYNVQLVGLGNSSVSGDFSASVTVVSGTQARTTAISSSLAEGSTTSIAVQVGNGNFVIPLGLGLAAARSGNNQTIEAVGSLNQAAFNNLVAQFFSNLPPGVFDNLATNQPLTDAEVRQRAAKLLTKFDKNNDNAITADEVGEEEWKALLKFDLNGDGRITVEELEAQIRADNEPKPQPPTEPGNGSPPKQNRPQGEGQQGKAQPGTQERSRATPSESPNKTSRAVPPGAGKGQSSSLQTSRSGRDGSQQANATRAWWNALRFWGEKNSDRSREIRNA